MSQVIDNSKNPNLNLVYTDDSGNKWYANINPLNISALRGLSAETAQRFVAMKISEKVLKELITQIKVAAGQNDIVKAFSIIEEINYRLTFLCEAESVLDLVFMYYFLEDENPEYPSDMHNEKKRKILTTDLKARAFFLRIGISLIKKFSTIPEEDLFSYLEKTKEEAKRVYRYLSSPNPEDLRTNSTD